ncbi:hypothetical protein DPMN_009683 [Dreissena polymorpha]|uniref:Uncharacterized protein n=1 Tax=Dreissena polymorpha TaxID=45954 RepID=A0A9D4N2N8_DREPO|nr:hypothetical protein DPMN_009683 [Dreissena polymorpha]
MRDNVENRFSTQSVFLEEVVFAHMGISGKLPLTEMELHPVPDTGFPPSLPEQLPQAPALHAERQPTSGETAHMSEPLAASQSTSILR